MEEEKLIIDVETEEERRIDQFLADQMGIFSFLYPKIN